MAQRVDEQSAREQALRMAEHDERLAQRTRTFDGELTPPTEVESDERELWHCVEMLHRVWKADSAQEPDGSLADDRPLESIGRYELIRELGRGGGGIVFLARDPWLGREVALKIPHPEGLLSARARSRFLREARATASLHHCGIVEVFDVGEDGPLCYLATAFCSGPTLAQWLAVQVVPVEPRAAARFIAWIAGAADHAHRHGVLHRDLKPANVLLFPDVNEVRGLDGFQPRLTDFGLAKLCDETGSTTRRGAIVGTPAYMAPEQAGGSPDAIGPAADVYALGAMLYELLTGNPPHVGSNDWETLLLVRQEEPQRPRQLRAEVPRDLETICLTALAKQPERRYSSAGALAEDLARFLEGKPIAARRTTLLERVDKWIRREPVLAATALACGLLVTLLATGAVLAAIGFRQQRNHAVTLVARVEAAESATRSRLFEARVQHARAAVLSGRPGQSREAWESIRQAVAVRPVATLSVDDRKSIRTTAIEALARWDLVPYGPRLAHSESREYTGVAIESTGRRLAWFREGKLEIRGFESGEPVVPLEWSGPCKRAILRFAPDATRVAGLIQVGETEYRLAVWDTASGRLLGTWSTLNPRPPYSHNIDFLSDGRIARLTVESTIVLDRIESSETQPLHVDGGEAARATGLVAHPLRSRIVVWSEGDLSVLDCETPRRVVRLPIWTEVTSATWDRSGRMLAVSCADHVARVWDMETATEKATPRALRGHQAWVVGATFTPDGRTLATTSLDGTTRLWDIDSGTCLMTTEGTALRFADEGRTLCFGLLGHEVGRWHVSPARTLRTLTADRPYEALDIAVHPTRCLVASASYDGLRLWDPQLGVQIEHNTGRSLWTVQFSADGRWLESRGCEGVKRWPIFHDNSTSIVGAPELVELNEANNVTSGSGGEEVRNAAGLIVQDVPGENRVVVSRGDEALFELTVTPGYPKSAPRITADARWLIARGPDLTLQVWDLEALAEALRELGLAWYP